MKLLYNEVNEKIRIQIDVEVWSHVSEQLFESVRFNYLTRY
jgi:hypothetical protein